MFISVSSSSYRARVSFQLFSSKRVAKCTIRTMASSLRAMASLVMCDAQGLAIVGGLQSFTIDSCVLALDVLYKAICTCSPQTCH